MKIRKNIFSKACYSSCIHNKNQKNLKLKKVGSPKDKLLENLNYYSRNEKKDILKKIFENITLKRCKVKEELLRFYLKDKDIKGILEEEKIFEESSKLFRIVQVQSNEEMLINKFNSFYDLLLFSIENLKRKSILSMNQKVFKFSDCSKCPSNNNTLEKYEFDVNNLDIIKKFMVIIDKNLTTYDNTSSTFKRFFCLHKFIIYFFNYSFPFIEIFDYKFLLKYTYLYIKLSLLESTQFFYEQKKKSENFFSVNISDEDLSYLSKNNNKNTLNLLLLLNNQVDHCDLLKLSELYSLYFKKIKIDELIKNVNNDSFEYVKNINEEKKDKSAFEKQHNNYGSILAVEHIPYEVTANEKNYKVNDMPHYHYGYFICVYFNFLFLLNKIVSNCIIFLPNIDKNIFHVLDCIGILCERIFEEHNNVGERKIKNLNLFLNNNDIENYIIKEIIKGRTMGNHFIGNKIEEKKKNNLLASRRVDEENYLLKEGTDYVENTENVLEQSENTYTNNFSHDLKRDILFRSNNDARNGREKFKYIYEGDEINFCNGLRIYNGKSVNDDVSFNSEEEQLLKLDLFYEECFLNLYRSTKNYVKLLFESMTDYFILYDCDSILKFLQIIYITRYMNMHNINVLFYSIRLNSEFLKIYQIKNILFFLALFKSSFIIKGINLQKSIYSWYNKRLIFFLRKKLELYFESSSLESSIKSIFLLCDLLNYNKVIKKILLKKLVLLNFNNIYPELFCQIFFLLNKLRFDASNKLFSELFLKHYKRIIPSLTCAETLDLIKNTEYLINKKKRKIFVIQILYFFRKLEQSSILRDDNTPVSLYCIFKLINIINKFKLYEYCRKDYFYPIYQFIFTANGVQNGLNKERKHHLLSDNNRDISKCNNNPSILVKNNEILLLDENEIDREDKRSDVLFSEKNESSISPRTVYGNGTFVRKECEGSIKIKLELLTINQILDLIYFCINTNRNIYSISELYTDLFYRLIRSTYFSKNQLNLTFRSIWMSRVFHAHFFKALVDIIINNKKIVDSSIFSLDILLCLCSYKHDKIYESLIISMFDICFNDIDKILKNINTQILFYYCFIFLEVYYPLLYLKVTKKRRNSFVKSEIIKGKLQNDGTDKNKKLIRKKDNFETNEEKEASSNIIDYNLEQYRINMNFKMIGKTKKMSNNLRESNQKNRINEDKIVTSRINAIYVEDSIDTATTVDILKYLKQLFFLQQKKHAYGYDLIKFYEILHKLNITKMKLNNAPNIFFKNQEINDLFVLNAYFPLLKFSILFIKKERVSKNVIKISDIWRMDKGTKKCGTITIDDASLLEVKNESSERNMGKKNICGSANVWSNVNCEYYLNNENKDSEIVSNSLFNDYCENQIDILAQKLYLYKNYRINVMVIPIEKVYMFFKIHDREEQNSIINESNIIFDRVYKEIMNSNKGQIFADVDILSSLMKKQLQYIFRLN
ncbi:conserved protein, unknown function [Plasmodium malariae]|uniref:Uncharacterized protein n=2 Tax=Plasmodium (Plasmodium) TaxID=418103 RepID=A0A1D3SQY2_PLAMA|nr:conserved protein, unknown function [Plasmodium malariae]SCO94200.1 conserved protein, unknown function [Plasmodium malariae]